MRLICTLLMIYSSVNTLPSHIPTGQIVETELGSLYLPSDYVSSGEYPLILLFHGLSEHHNRSLENYGWRELADTYGLILFSVRSQKGTWYYDDDSPDLGNARKAARQLKKRFSIKRGCTAVYGFSAGAHYITFLVLRNGPLRRWFNGFIQISGGPGFHMEKYLREGHIPRRFRVPGYMVWGEREVPPPGKDLAEVYIQQGWDITTHPHDGPHYVPEGELELAVKWFLEKCSE